ncbi:MAG: hypothetical protein ABIR70_01545 [Bryobacteraceae bacterium]
MTIQCKICNQRRAKRHCPGVDGEICAICCAEGREITIDCPRECPHLREARGHEAKIVLTADQVPNRDIEVSEDFVRHHEHLVLMLGNTITRAMEKGKAVDSDAREAIEAMIQVYRGLESGLIFESRLANPYAADIQDALKSMIEELRAKVAEATGENSVRDKDLLGTLVFLQRLALQYDNGRRRGRVFFDFLMDHFPAVAA